MYTRNTPWEHSLHPAKEAGHNICWTNRRRNHGVHRGGAREGDITPSHESDCIGFGFSEILKELRKAAHGENGVELTTVCAPADDMFRAFYDVLMRPKSRHCHVRELTTLRYVDDQTLVDRCNSFPLAWESSKLVLVALIGGQYPHPPQSPSPSSEYHPGRDNFHTSAFALFSAAIVMPVPVFLAMPASAWRSSPTSVSTPSAEA